MTLLSLNQTRFYVDPLVLVEPSADILISLNETRFYADRLILVEPSADILICGNCKQTFTDVKTLSTHKNRGCRLRFTCRCQHQSPDSNNSGAYNFGISE